MVKLPSLALSVFFLGLQRSVRLCVVVMVDDAPPVDQFWVFFFNFFLQFIQLLTVDIRINISTGWKELRVENFLPIPPNRKHSLLLIKVCFYGGSFFNFFINFVQLFAINNRINPLLFHIVSKFLEKLL